MVSLIIPEYLVVELIDWVRLHRRSGGAISTMPRTDVGQTASQALAATSRALKALRLTVDSAPDLRNDGQLDDLEVLCDVLKTVDGRLVLLEDPSGPFLHDVKPLLGKISHRVSLLSCLSRTLDEDLSAYWCMHCTVPGVRAHACVCAMSMVDAYVVFERRIHGRDVGVY